MRSGNALLPSCGAPSKLKHAQPSSSAPKFQPAPTTPISRCYAVKCHAHRSGSRSSSLPSCLSSPSSNLQHRLQPLQSAVTDEAAVAAVSSSSPASAPAGPSPNPNATASLTFQEAITRLQLYWSSRDCAIWLPHNTEVGAGTMNPATFLRVLGPEPWNVAYVEPSIRPDDSRYGDNPNRLQRHTQFQVCVEPVRAVWLTHVRVFMAIVSATLSALFRDMP